MRGQYTGVLELRYGLEDWTDVDVAVWAVARALQVIPPRSFAESKYFTNVGSPLNTFVYNLLLAMADAGVLERRDDPDEQFRWAMNYGEFPWGTMRYDGPYE